MAAALLLQRLRETGQPAEQFEPNLSLTAATCWLQAGMTDKARETLATLRERHPTLRVAVGGREVPIFTDNSQAVEWLADLIGPQRTAGTAAGDGWLMFHGDVARNAPAGGGAPLLNLRWRVPSTDDPLAANTLAQNEKTHAEEGHPILPALHPLAVGDVLLMRTLLNLWAVDAATGKRLWKTPTDETTELSPGMSLRDVQMRQATLASGAGQRMLGDMTYGTLSSDGRYVFSVEDLELEAGPSVPVQFRQIAIRRRGVFAAPQVGPGGADNEPPPVYNRLAAHDIRTGKLKWQLGGPAGQYALRQAETFFLGPPLPLMGQLYVLAESKGDIRLLALDAATGDLVWSQQLASAETDAATDSHRRFAGASPSYADGILVCPTTAGAVVGVELATRSLLWGYCYRLGFDGSRRNNGIMFFPGGMSPEPEATPHSVDGSATISAGRVLITPADSDCLYCLSLIDGKLLWKHLREDDLYVACVDGEKVVLVGRGGVRARRLANGELAWGGRTIVFPDNSMPSGRGFLVAGSAAGSAAVPAAMGGQDAHAPGQDARAPASRYFLPLNNAEVVAIDLAAGKIVQVSRSRQGNVPGNLLCHRGQIISQGLEAVDAYGQLDVVRDEVRQRLAANPNDAEAISLEGEVLLESGNRPEAIASFRQGVSFGPGPADPRVVSRRVAGRFADRLRRLPRLGPGDSAAVGQSHAASDLSPLNGRRPAPGG